MSDSVNTSQTSAQSFLDSKIKVLESEGYTVEFGFIGKRTTYCMLQKEDREIVGYTYIRGDLSTKDETVGRFRALQQALNRKYLLYDQLNI